MYFIESEFSFDSAHFLKDHPGKCKFIHGHRWKVVVSLKSKSLNNGMIVDFTDLKNVLKELEERFDHTLIIEKDSMTVCLQDALKAEGFKITEVNFRPTAENFSESFFNLLDKFFIGMVHEVAVYETPTNKAAYRRKK